MGVNSLPWSYLPLLEEAGSSVSLTGDEWHHCYNVLRMEEGDMLLLFNGQGLCMEGTIRIATKNEGRIDLTRDLTDSFRVHRPYTLTELSLP